MSTNSLLMDEDIDPKQQEEESKQIEQLNEKIKNHRLQNEKLIPILKKQWNATLVDWMRQPHEDAKVRARALGLARQGTVPPSLRGVVWVRGISNSLQVTQTLYETCVARAETTQAALTKEREAEASGAIDIDIDDDDNDDPLSRDPTNNGGNSSKNTLSSYLGYGEDFGPAVPMRGFEIDPKFITAGPLPTLDTVEEKEAGKLIMNLLKKRSSKTKKQQQNNTIRTTKNAVDIDIQTVSVTEALQKSNLQSPPKQNNSSNNAANKTNPSNASPNENNIIDDDDDDDDDLTEFKDVSSPLRSNPPLSSSSTTNERVGFSPSVSSPLPYRNNNDEDNENIYMDTMDSDTELPLDKTETVIVQSARQRNLFAPKTLKNSGKKENKKNGTPSTITTTATTSNEVSENSTNLSSVSSSSVRSTDDKEASHASSISSLSTLSLSPTVTNPTVASSSSGTTNDNVTSSISSSSSSSSAPAPSSSGVFSFLTTALWWSNQSKKKPSTESTDKPESSNVTNDTTVPIMISPPKPKPLKAATSFVSRDGSLLRSTVPLHGHEGSIDAIEMDLDRIFPEYRAFFAPGAYARQQLIRVLSAYAFFRPDHGYIQGMSHLAAILILTVGSLAPSAEDLRLIERSRKSKVTTAQEADVFSWQSSALARAKGAAKETNAAIQAADNSMDGDGKSTSDDSNASSFSSSSWFTFFGAPAPTPAPPETVTATVAEVRVPSGNGKKKSTTTTATLSDEESLALSLPPLPSEVIVFICFTNLMGRAPLRWLASRDHVRMDIWYELYSTVLNRTCPKLAKFFDDNGIKPNLYLVSWLLTLFSKPLGLEASTRLWDVCLIGGQTEILKCAIGLTKFLENRLLYRSFERVMRTLVNVPTEYQNPYGVLEAAESVKLLPSDLAKLAAMDMM